MRVRLGIIGPRQSEAMFAACAQRMTGVQTRWLLYESDDEIAGIGEEAKLGVDALFFAGPLAFDKVRPMLPPGLPTTVVRPRAIDLSLALLKARGAGFPLGPVSIDSFDEGLVAEVFDELDADESLATVRSYDARDSVDALVEFHLRARRDGAQYAITGRSGVYAALRERLGDNLLRALPMPATIRAAMNEAALQAVSVRHSQLRFSAALFKILGDNTMHDAEIARLNLARLLRESPELEEAWIEDRGDRTLLVFAHKGLMESITETWTTVPVIDDAQTQIGVQVAVGFGVAESARRTVRHAEMALHRAEAESGPCGYAFTDDGLVIGPMHGSGKPLRYAFKAEDSDYVRAAREIGLGVSTLSRLVEFEKRLAGATASAAEIGAALRVSATSGRRIVRALVSAGMARAAGLAQPAQRGRPKHLYQLMVHENLKSEGALEG